MILEKPSAHGKMVDFLGAGSLSPSGNISVGAHVWLHIVPKILFTILSAGQGRLYRPKVCG